MKKKKVCLIFFSVKYHDSPPFTTQPGLGLLCLVGLLCMDLVKHSALRLTHLLAGWVLLPSRNHIKFEQ